MSEGKELKEYRRTLTLTLSLKVRPGQKIEVYDLLQSLPFWKEKGCAIINQNAGFFICKEGAAY